MAVFAVLALIRTVEKSAFVVTTDLTVCDGYILSGPRVAERKTALRANGIVEWRVDATV